MNCNKVLGLFLLFLFAAGAGRSQTAKNGARKTTASGQQRFCEQAFNLAKTNPDSAIIMAQQGIEEAKRLNNPADLQCNYNALGLAYNRKGFYHKAVDAFNQSLDILNSLNDQSDAVNVYYNISTTYSNMHNFPEAMKSLKKAQDGLIALKDTLRLPFIFSQLGIIYREMGDFKEAEKYILKSIALYGPMKDTADLAKAYISYGNLLQVSDRLQDAVLKHQQGIDLENRLHDRYNLAIGYENLAKDYDELNESTLALTNFNKALQLMKDLHNEIDVGYESMNLGNVYVKTGDFVKAKEALDLAQDIFSKNGADSYRRTDLEILSELYVKMGDDKTALAYYKHAVALRDSLDTDAQAHDLNVARAEFESDQKEQRIALLNKDNQLQSEQIQRQSLLIILGVVLLIVALVVGWLLYSRARISNRLEEMSLRNRIASDLHDDVGSTLSSIKMYSDLVHAQISRSEPLVLPLLEKISSNAMESIDNISEIVWSINPKNDQLADLVGRLEQYATDVCNARNISFSMQNQLAAPPYTIPMNLRKNIFLIFKEAIHNAVKYSGASHIRLLSKREGRFWLLELSDDGAGFDPALQGNGNGLRNMKLRAEEIKASFSILPLQPRGTLIRLKVAIP